NTFLLGNEIKGEMLLKVEEEVEVESVEVKLLVEAKGLMSSQSALIYHKTHKKPGLLKPGEIYRFPISVIPNKYGSYKGEQVEISFRFEGELKLLEQKASEKIRNFFRKLGNSSKNQDAYFIHLTSPIESYRLRDQKISLDSNSSYQSFLGLPLLIMFFVLVGKEVIDYSIGIPIGLLFSLLCIIYYLIGRYAVGNPSAEIVQEDKEGFHVKLYKEPSWHFLRGIEVSYEIVEEVLDRRGTSSTTHKKVLFDSLVQKSRLNQEELDFYFDFPYGKPKSMNWEDVSIIWRLKLKVFTSLGFNYKVYGPFIVKKSLDMTETQR
ncbi:MAG: hypothetical protein AAF696_30555, partial [Bacteroidota bacterium]